MLKAYLSAQPSSLSAFMICKTQKPRGRQLNAKVCGSESAIFRIVKAVDKLFSLGVLTFTAHNKQLCAVAKCSILQIQMPKIWGCFSTPKHPLIYGLEY